MYKPLQERIFADIDNERVIDYDVVGLTQSDIVQDFFGNKITINDGEYVYLYMDIGDGDYVFAEGFVIPNPYSFKPYKWCCKLVGEIEYIENYLQRFSNDIN